MNSLSYKTGNITAIKEVLLKALQQNLPGEKISTIKTWSDEIHSHCSHIQILQKLGRIPALTGKQKLNWSSSMLQEAAQCRKHWNPSEWTCDEAARVYLLLTWAESEDKNFVATFEKYFNTADVGEMQVVLKALPLLPKGEQYVSIAALGARSNIKTSFDAIALNNPYPSENFDMESWNQMVLKAIFVEAPIYKIVGLDERSNARLAVMLCDFAHERWAAGRYVSPELWRPVSGFIDAVSIKDIERVLSSTEEIFQHAALMACATSPNKEAKEMLKKFPSIASKIEQKEINWDSIGVNWILEKQKLFSN